MSVLKLTVASSGILLVLVLSNALFEWKGLAVTSITILSSLTAAVLFFLLVYMVFIPLKKAESVLKNVSGGGLNVRSDVKATGEFGELAAHVSKLVRLLKESGVRRKDLFKALPDAAIELDETGAVVYMNEAALTLTGYAASDISKIDYTDLTSNESRNAMKELFREAMGGNAAAGREINIVDRDGRTFLIEFSAIPLWSGAATEGCVLIGRDIEEKMRLKEELKNSRLEAGDAAGKLNKMIKDLEEFSIMTVRREQKMREIRERLMELKKDTISKKDPLDRSA